MSTLLSDLNPEQRLAVQHDDGPLLVAAGPGSGKTRVITHRIAYRVLESGVSPSRILAVTFTNRAAREMSERVGALVGDDTRVPVGTFHWMCAGILRRYIHLLGNRSNFRVLTPRESHQVLRSLLPTHATSSTRHTGTVADAISGLKSGVEDAGVARDFGIPEDELARLRLAYDERLRAMNALDLDDLPALAGRVLREHESCKNTCRSALDELLVDEYQDTNLIQQELVELLCPRSGSVIVVGDEDQAIYAWRHADARGVARFLQAFPAASLVSLERSYRHSKHIARAATALIQHNTQRAPRRIRTERAAGPRPVCYGAADERDEAEWVAGEISRLASEEGVAWQDIAVLYRVNAQSRAIEDILLRRSIPYRILSGRSFYAQPEVQRASVYLRLATDSTDDEAMRRLLSGVMGMGSTRLTLLQTSAERRGLSLYAFLDSGDQMPSLPAAVRARLASLADRAQRVVARRRESLIDVVGEAISAVGEELAAEGRDSDTALDDLDELLSLARRYHAGRGTLREFVDALALDTGTDSSPAGVNLISLHAAKGLEFSTVFLVGLEEGLLPHRRSLERREDVDEERRLCYVGMTRARDRLYLSYAQMRMLAGSGVTGQPSRFIGEIGPQNMVLKISRTAQLKPRLPEVGPGDRVMHPRWGAGTVERVEGQGRDTLTTIHFDRAGRQRLQLCHAPLSLLTQGSSHVAAG